MRRESKGGERLVSCCGDGDIVEVGEGDDDGVVEREEKRQENGTTGRSACAV